MLDTGEREMSSGLSIAPCPLSSPPALLPAWSILALNEIQRKENCYRAHVTVAGRHALFQKQKRLLDPNYRK